MSPAGQIFNAEHALPVVVAYNDQVISKRLLEIPKLIRLANKAVDLHRASQEAPASPGYERLSESPSCLAEFSPLRPRPQRSKQPTQFAHPQACFWYLN